MIACLINGHQHKVLLKAKWTEHHKQGHRVWMRAPWENDNDVQTLQGRD